MCTQSIMATEKSQTTSRCVDLEFCKLTHYVVEGNFANHPNPLEPCMEFCWKCGRICGHLAGARKQDQVKVG